jgi:hypothetical protein
MHIGRTALAMTSAASERANGIQVFLADIDIG